MLNARELGRRAGRHAEDEARERFDQQFLRAVGEHRDEDENRELARGRLAPNLRESLAETAALRALSRARPRLASIGFDAHDRQTRDEESDGADGRRHFDQTRVARTDRGNGPRAARSIAKPKIIMTQTVVAAAARRAGATREASIASTEVPAAPAPMPTIRKRQRREREAERQDGRGERGRERRAGAAEREHGHAADDPGRAPPADVGAIAPGRTQDLHGVMRSDQQARNKGGKRELDDHHTIDRRGHQHDDRARARSGRGPA